MSPALTKFSLYPLLLDVEVHVVLHVALLDVEVQVHEHLENRNIKTTFSHLEVDMSLPL